MKRRNKTITQLAIIAMILLAGLLLITGCDPSESTAVRERIAINAKEDSWVRYGADFYFYSDDRSTQKILLEGSDGDIDMEGDLDVAKTTTLGGAITVNDNVLIDGDSDEVQLTAQGHSTQTSAILAVEDSAGTDRFTVDAYGNVIITPTLDAATTDYDYWLEIAGALTGVGTKDRSYGIYIEMARAAGYEIQSGDFDEAGIKIRVDTHAVTTTAGTVLRGIDCEAKADNPDGTVTNLYGASLTAKSDTSAGSVDNMIGLTTNVQNNALVTTTLISADFRLYRQAATAPTSEFITRIRSSSSSGSGCDAAIYIESDYTGSATTDSIDYGVDMSAAAINTADLRLENGETIHNGTDNVVAIGGALGVVEGTAIPIASGGQITVTASTYLPITSSAGITTSATTAISDGAYVGQILIIVNENAADTIVIKNGANTHLTGDITLGNDDTLTLIWDGADWLQLATSNNS